MPARPFALVALAAAVGLAAAVELSTASAQDATGATAARKASMQANSAHMGANRAILSEQPELIAHVVAHARAVESVAARLPEMFIEGTGGPPSRALPAVWENWDAFVERAGALEAAAANLAETAEGGDVQATLAAFAATGQTCGACHNDFRGPAN